MDDAEVIGFTKEEVRGLLLLAKIVKDGELSELGSKKKLSGSRPPSITKDEWDELALFTFTVDQLVAPLNAKGYLTDEEALVSLLKRNQTRTWRLRLPCLIAPRWGGGWWTSGRFELTRAQVSRVSGEASWQAVQRALDLASHSSFHLATPGLLELGGYFIERYVPPQDHGIDVLAWRLAGDGRLQRVEVDAKHSKTNEVDASDAETYAKNARQRGAVAVIVSNGDPDESIVSGTEILAGPRLLDFLGRIDPGIAGILARMALIEVEKCVLSPMNFEPTDATITVIE